jgi:hypothetical protein
MLLLFLGLGVLPLLALGTIGYVRSMRAVEELLATETATIARSTPPARSSTSRRYSTRRRTTSGGRHAGSRTAVAF